ncbi:MAG: hypothetical protein FWH48_10245 [Oscillospiraceae bacterium]|nr:hypothetical protein [Oscillospiraceae bacterium]
MIKRFFLAIIILGFVLCIAACSDNSEELFDSFDFSACSDNNEELFDGFDFSLGFGYGGGKNCIDTYNGTFTKDLIPGTKTIELIVPEDKMREIYELFLDYKIYDLPQNIRGENRVMPDFTYIFTYTYKKSTKTIVCENVDSIRYFGEKGEQKNFISFADMIRDYVFNTEEYENMPPANGGYL